MKDKLIKYIRKESKLYIRKHTKISAYKKAAFYVEEEKGAPKGVVVAIGKNKVGWSLCDHEDTFDKQYGMNLAIARAESMDWYLLDYHNLVPKAIIGEFETMMERSNAYFK